MKMTYEERLECDLADTRRARNELIEEKSELCRRLVQAVALLETPLKDEQPDVLIFGRSAWVYCRQHRKPHQTGWCSIGERDKIGLGVATAEEAYAKCREWGLPICGDDT